MTIMRSLAPFVAALVALSASPGIAADQPAQAASPYAGQETQDIASLSPDDVRQLLDGAGWGLAKPAELNGYPGPAHVLELGDRLGLSTEQRARVQSVFDTMKRQAQAIGKAFVAREAELSAAFASGKAELGDIARLIAVSSELYGQLRATHLAAHIAIYPVLSPHQRMLYNEARGYSGGTGQKPDHGAHTKHHR